MLARAVFALLLLLGGSAWAQEAYYETPEGTLLYREAGQEGLMDVSFKPKDGGESIVFGASLEIREFFYSSEASDPKFVKGRGVQIARDMEYVAHAMKSPMSKELSAIQVLHVAGRNPESRIFTISNKTRYAVDYTNQNILYIAIEREDNLVVHVFKNGKVVRAYFPSRFKTKDIRINYDAASTNLKLEAGSKFVSVNLRSKNIQSSADIRSQVALDELLDKTSLPQTNRAPGQRPARMKPRNASGGGRTVVEASEFVEYAPIGGPAEDYFDLSATYPREAHEFDLLAAAITDPQNPRAVITGEAGSGRSEFVNSFISEVRSANVDGVPSDTLFWIVNASEFENSSAGSTSEFIDKLVQGINKVPYPVVLVIDNIDQLAYKGTHRDNPVGALSALNSYLTNKKIKIIGISNPDNYDATIGSDPSLKKNLPAIKFVSPTPQETFRRMWVRIQKENLGFTQEQLALIINYADQFDPNESILSRSSRLLNKISALCNRKKIEVEDLDERTLREFIAEIYSIDRSYVFTELAREAHLKFKQSVEEDFFLDPALQKHLIELDAAYRNENYRRNQKVPVGRILLAGPPGKGKTHIAQQTAEFMGLPFHRLSLADFMTQDGVTRLREAIGKIISEQPLSLIFIDELEKAYDREGYPNELQTTLLSILDSDELKYSRKIAEGSEHRRFLKVRTNHSYFMFGGNINPSVIESMRKRGNTLGFQTPATAELEAARKLSSNDLISSGYNPNLVSRLVPYYYDGPQTRIEHVKLIAHVLDRMLADYGMTTLDSADAAELEAYKKEMLTLAFDEATQRPKLSPRDIVNHIKIHFELSWVVSKQEKYASSASSCLARLKGN